MRHHISVEEAVAIETGKYNPLTHQDYSPEYREMYKRSNGLAVRQLEARLVMQNP